MDVDLQVLKAAGVKIKKETTISVTFLTPIIYAGGHNFGRYYITLLKNDIFSDQTIATRYRNSHSSLFEGQIGRASCRERVYVLV